MLPDALWVHAERRRLHPLSTDFDGAPDRLATGRAVEPTYDISSEKLARLDTKPWMLARLSVLIR
jgi:hypothetical protein